MTCVSFEMVEKSRRGVDMRSQGGLLLEDLMKIE